MLMQCGALQLALHSLHKLSLQGPGGHLISQSGLSHLISHLSPTGSSQRVLHCGGRQIGSQTAGQSGSVQCHEHSGLHGGGLSKEAKTSSVIQSI